MKKLISLLLMSYFINSCALNNRNIYYKKIKNINLLMHNISNNIEYLWGKKELIIPNKKNYLKYTDNYNTRSYINFDTGKIIIESINNKNAYKNIKKAIIKTILINKNPEFEINLLKKNKSDLLLYNQILDHYDKPIYLYKEAEKFATYLINKKLKKRYTGKKILSVTISMVKNHLDQRVSKYLPIIYKAAKKYKVNQALILSIMHIESSFNPYAISSSEAVGLMQIVRKTAGADVFRFKGKFGIPSRRYLLNPEKNIDIGVAYLSILQENYLSEIVNPISKSYAVITAYNGGIKNLLKTFSNNKNFAFQKINAISPQKVYQKLILEHPSEETRKYLFKVNKIKNKYTKIKMFNK